MMVENGVTEKLVADENDASVSAVESSAAVKAEKSVDKESESTKTVADPVRKSPVDPPEGGETASTAEEAGNSSPQKPTSSKVSSFGFHRHFRFVDINPDTCLMPEAKSNTRPSIADGMTLTLDCELRYFGCELIQAAAILLKLPQVAAATGQILYQRYFCTKSFVRTNFEHVAMACVCLASKIEEVPRRPRDVINVFHHLKELSKCRNRQDRKPHPLVLDQSYTKLKNEVIKAERRVLNVLGFCVHTKHPHKLITAYMKALQVTDIGMVQMAWNYMNDGLRTDIFLRYTPETIACACIFLTARVKQVPLPMEPKPWWELFDATESDINDIATMLLRLYKRKKVPSWSRIHRERSALTEQYESSLRPKLPTTTATTTQSTSAEVVETSGDSGKNKKKPTDSGRKRSPSRSRSRSSTPPPRRRRSPITFDDRDRDRDRRRVGGSGRAAPVRSPSDHRINGEPAGRRGRGRDPPSSASKRPRARSPSHSASSSPDRRRPAAAPPIRKEINKRYEEKYGQLIRKRERPRGGGGGKSESGGRSSGKRGGRERDRRGGSSSDTLSPPPISKSKESVSKRSRSPRSADREKLARKEREREVMGVLGKRRLPTSGSTDNVKRYR